MPIHINKPAKENSNTSTKGHWTRKGAVYQKWVVEDVNTPF